MDDIDLSAMTLEEAREYVLAYITTLKQTRRQMEQQVAEISLWRERSRMAAERGASDLAAKAAEVADQHEAQRTVIEAEVRGLEATVPLLKENLRRLEITGTRLVDTDRLLAELEMAVGEEKAAEIRTDRAVRETQAESALEEMKRKIRGNDPA
jgi:phage shock protein A